MDRFLANADPKKREESIEITREMSRIRGRLHDLRNHKVLSQFHNSPDAQQGTFPDPDFGYKQPLSIPDTFDHVREALGELNEPELDITPDFLQALENEKQQAKLEIEYLENQLPGLKSKMDRLWDGDGEKRLEYELVAVFMHRGRTSGAGHYWTYQAHLPDHSESFGYLSVYRRLAVSQKQQSQTTPC